MEYSHKMMQAIMPKAKTKKQLKAEAEQKALEQEVLDQKTSDKQEVADTLLKLIWGI